MTRKKILVTYYSRTGTTRKIGEELAEKLKADKEEIIDTKDRSGVKGYITAGRDAMKKTLTEIKKTESNLAEYDLVLIGTPIWAWNVSTPVRTFLAQNCNWIQKTAFFCTMGGSGDMKAFDEMISICGKRPTATLSLTTKDVKKNRYAERLDAFVSAMRKLAASKKDKQ